MSDFTPYFYDHRNSWIEGMDGVYYRADEVGESVSALRSQLAASEKELRKWEKPHDQELFDDIKKQSSHSNSLAAQGLYIVALEKALKQSEKALAEAKGYERVAPDAILIDGKHYRQMTDEETAAFIWSNEEKPKPGTGDYWSAVTSKDATE